MLICVLHFPTMTRTFKTYVLWLLIAVMPFQAFAANVLRACGAGHQGMSMLVVAQAAKATVGQDSGRDIPTNEPVSRAEHCKDAVSSKPAVAESSDSSKQGSCSACAACTVGAYAPVPTLTFKPAFNSAEVYETLGVTLIAGFIPDSLKRPPRFSHS